MCFMSLLCNAKLEPSQVLLQMPMEIRGDLTLKVKPIKIIDRVEKTLHNKMVPLIKVMWRNSQVEEET